VNLMAIIQAFLLCTSLQGQVPESPPRPPDADSASLKFAHQFCQAINQRKPDLFRRTFAPNLLAELDPEKLTAVVDDFLEFRGKIKNIEQTDELGGVVFFKLTTDKGITNLKINLVADGLIDSFEFKDWPTPLPVPSRNSMSMHLPFQEEWQVIWGGRDPVNNYHMTLDEMSMFATDFSILNDEGMSYKGDGASNEDFFSFGKEVLAVSSGRVTLVLEGFRDNLPGHSDPLSATGNTVFIDHSNRQFSTYAHLKQNSIMVKVGDTVKTGQVIARCGNSGRSREPHLHFGLLNSDNATFATGFPVFFSDITVKRDGRMEMVKDYEPKRRDRVSPATTSTTRGISPAK
jgi:hypothetical protein